MTRITTLNRATTAVLAAEINSALIGVGKDLGLSLQMSGGTYSPDGLSATLKLSVTVRGADGTTVSQEGLALDRVAKELYGTTSPRGKEVTVYGQSFTLVGYKPKSRKLPFLGRAANGKLYKLPDIEVRQQVGMVFEFEKKTISTRRGGTR